MAVVYYFLKDEAKMKAAYEEALKRVDRMTPREKYRTLGAYSLFSTHNYEQCIEDLHKLVFLYPADGPAYNHLSICYARAGIPKPSLT